MPEARTLSVAQAADRLGMSTVSVYSMIANGRLPRVPMASKARVHVADVDRVAEERRTEARRRVLNEEGYAGQIRDVLHPPVPETITLADGRVQARDLRETVRIAQLPRGREALKIVLHGYQDAVAIFGKNVLTAAALAGDACAWCYAIADARVHELPEPQDSPALRVLLGEPCPRDLVRWAADDAERRLAMVKLKEGEHAARREAERQRLRAEFSVASLAARTAASRLASTRARLAVVDPASVALAASSAGGPTGPGSLRCGCTADRYCLAHAELFGTRTRT
ncbi:helix-turn-helix domain-containing protein [Streptomyces sp. NPDC041068]|uniref:helix-turn-helix domain-containing protein n=1 Tax=Streptomyces sp. NPDC041068 TaxID=3155130 RepID=UPI003402EBD9